MKTIASIVLIIAMSGVGFAFIGVTPVTNSPPITRFTETDSAPTMIGAQIVPVEGSIHINGQVAPSVPGFNSKSLSLIVDNVAQTTYQRWAVPGSNVYVERSILINGVQYKDDTQPLAIVWTAVIITPGNQFPTVVHLDGSDFNCSGGGISVSP